MAVSARSRDLVPALPALVLVVVVVMVVEQVEALLGPIDVLVNNAGVAVESPSLRHTKRDWEKVRSGE